MGLKVVGISEMAVSSEPEDVIVTYSLGSCVGVTLFDPVRKIGGMIHCMLPVSTKDREKAAIQPAMFVDTGVLLLIRSLLELGVDGGDLVCKVAGAGSSSGAGDRFKVGEKNYAVLSKILAKNGIRITGELIGGSSPKTMFLYMDSGRTTVRENQRKEVEI